FAAGVTALMTGQAYLTSAQLSARVGPFEAFEENRDSFFRVMDQHRASLDHIDSDSVPKDLFSAAAAAWDDAIGLGSRHGYRNAQATVLAPTGTIAFMM
ncbi:MAG: vitamin B12-dependent ribonucleotide reductase, partial [Planctomycetota bacterium]|nr:vitamin B12-dependent ribonucleotide reductase [Planctomycetota bacterium]